MEPSDERAPTTDDRATVAEHAARRGAEVAAETFRGELDVETKTRKTDLVTQADRASQRAVLDALDEAAPDEPVVAEEADALKEVPAEGPAWIVDPIDGTANYVRGIQVWGTSVAAVRDGRPVAAANVFPALGDVYVADESGAWLNGEPIAVSDRTDPETFAVALPMWWKLAERERFGDTVRRVAERFGDLRRFGCAQAILSMTASGGLDGVATSFSLHPWDAVAGVLLVENAGGTVTDAAGEPWRVDADGLVASNGNAHGELVTAIGDPDADR